MSFNLLKEKEKILEIMGSYQDVYWDLMRRYCRMEISFAELAEELNRFLTPKQRHSHSQFFLKFIQNGMVESPPPTIRQYRVLHPSECTVVTRCEVEGQIPSSMATEGLIYDFPSMMSRLKFGVAEMGLDCSKNVVYLLLAAVKTFLKNILTAVVMRRKGFKRRRNGFVHTLGVPESCENMTKRQLESDEPFQSLLIDENASKMEEILVPNMRMTPEEIERDRAFNLSLQDRSLAPVSLHDLLLTLQLFPSLVASNFVSSVNIERIYARLRHPYCEI